MQYNFGNKKRDKSSIAIRYIAMCVVVVLLFGALVGKLVDLQLREGQEHAALYLSHLNTWPTCGTAGGPRLRNEPAGNRGAPGVGAGEDTGRQSKETTKGE